jgi:uncharacterized protein DUF5701
MAHHLSRSRRILPIVDDRRNLCDDTLRCARVTSLPPLPEQARRLVDLGVPGAAEAWVTAGCAATRAAPPDDALLVVHPAIAAPSALAPLVSINGKPGFVVTDMTDLDEFEPIVSLPDSPIYLAVGPNRGGDMANWSPDEALPAIAARGRTPLTLTEGLHWLLQRPGALERNGCFMTIASRRRKPDGRTDARTPAIWFSNGTGRDGRENRDAPKIGWCWAGNRHTWLGFASAAARGSLTPAGSTSSG